MECPYCQKEIKSNQGFGAHLKRIHQKTYEQHLHETIVPWPKCKCGCGKDVPLHNHGTKVSEYVHGHNNINFEHQSHAGYFGGIALKGRKHTAEHNNKISLSTVKNYQTGGGSWKRGEFYSKKNNKINIYRSSWELQFMEELEADDNVESYSYEEFCINYIFEGTKRRYLPDFVVKYKDGRHKIIEIGQKKQKAAGMDLAKITAAQEFCKKLKWEFELITDVHFGR